MTLPDIVFTAIAAFGGYMFRAVTVWVCAPLLERGRLGARVISGVPLPCPSDHRWQERKKVRLTRTRSAHDLSYSEDVREVPILRLGNLCVDEIEVALYVLRDDGTADTPIPGAEGYALQVIRQHQARRALESLAKEV